MSSQIFLFGPKANNCVAFVRYAESILHFDPGVCIKDVCVRFFLILAMTVWGISWLYCWFYVCYELITRWVDEHGRRGASEKWSNLAFCAEREIEMEGEIKREWDNESQRGKQKMVFLLKHNLKRHDSLLRVCVCVSVFWQEMRYVIYLNDTACPHELLRHTHTHT